MPSFEPSQGGTKILATLSNHLSESRRAIEAAMARTDWPVEHKRRLRDDAVADARGATAQARAAIVQWATEAHADATRRYRADPVRGAAEEQRRVANELRFQREVDSAVRAAERIGSAKRVAQDLADKAASTYLGSDRYEEALAYAIAADELGHPQGKQLRATIQQQIDLGDPDKARALKDLAEVASVMATLDSDVEGALAGVLQAASVAARQNGDDGRQLAKDAASQSASAKMRAWYLARANGEEYSEPAGTLPSAPNPVPPMHGGRETVIDLPDGGHKTTVSA